MNLSMKLYARFFYSNIRTFDDNYIRQRIKTHRAGLRDLFFDMRNVLGSRANALPSVFPNLSLVCILLDSSFFSREKELKVVTKRRFSFVWCDGHEKFVNRVALQLLRRFAWEIDSEIDLTNWVSCSGETNRFRLVIFSIIALKSCDKHRSIKVRRSVQIDRHCVCRRLCACVCTRACLYMIQDEQAERLL